MEKDILPESTKTEDGHGFGLRTIQEAAKEEEDTNKQEKEPVILRQYREHPKIFFDQHWK